MTYAQVEENSRPSLAASAHLLWGFRHHNTAFYQSTAWRKLRAVKLAEEPMCEECARQGRVTPAQMVDHIIPINKGGAPLDVDNLQSLCNACHARKSAKDR